MDDSAQNIAGDSAEISASAIAAVARIDAVPSLLQLLCETTGMRCAAVVRVTGDAWTACAVHDDGSMGIRSGTRFDGGAAFFAETGPSRAPLFIGSAGMDPRFRDHPMRRRYQIESCVAVPIVLGDGLKFGSLCAMDSRPTTVAQPHVVSMFTRFASLIAGQLDGQLRQEREHLALLDERATGELREQFMAVLGHDLRNPLQAVYAGADQLVRKLADSGHAQIAERIKANAHRMSLLIDDILDFARGRLGGGIQVDSSAADNVNAGLAAVVRELEDAQPECQIQSDLRVSRPVCCDLGRLQQVASNLLANALTHGRRDSPVKISARVDDKELVLEVWNAGEPIPRDSLGKIFEPFWRRSVSPSRHGLGLGLHICSEIVRAHNGRIGVTSTAEEGTRFSARFPLDKARTIRPLLEGDRVCATPHRRSANAG